MTAPAHPFSQEEIMSYLDGELSPKRVFAAALHLEQCGECRILSGDFQIVSRVLAEWEVEPNTATPPRLAPRQGSPKPNPWKKWGLWMAGAAALVLLMVAVPFRLSRPQSAALADHAVETLASAPAGYAPTPSPAPASGPQIVRTAQLKITSDRFDISRAMIERITIARQGYIAQLELSTSGESGRSLDATVRVPAAQLDAVLHDLKALGRVDEESQTGEDVTQRYVDLNARLANLRTTEQRLLEMLRQRAGSLADVLQVEEAVDRTRGEIEVAEAEQKSLVSQIAFASVHVSVAEDYQIPVGGDRVSVPMRLRNAAVAGYRNLIGGVVAVLTFLLSAGPALLVLLAVTFFPARWLWRKWRAR
jgi:hypothetical protein